MQEWLGGPRAGLTEDEVRESISWRHGMRTRFGVEFLNYDETVMNPQPNLLVRGGDIEWSYRVPDHVTGRATDTAQVRRTGSLEIYGDVGSFNPLTTKFRPWIEAQSPTTGNWVRWHQGLFVSTLPAITDDGAWISRSLQLADKTHIWSKELDKHWIAPFNRNIVLFVREDVLVPIFGETKFNLPATDRVVEEDMVFEPGTTYLEMMNVVLEHGGFEPLTVDADGAAYTQDAEAFATKAPEHTYEPGGAVRLESQVESLLPEVPNVLIFVAQRGPTLPEEGNGIRTLKNQSVGPGSIDARGGEEVRHRVEVDARMGPTTDPNQYLDAIAHAEAQKYFAGGGLRFKGQVGLNPRHDDRDVVALVKPRFGLNDATEEWLVTHWRIPLRPVENDSDVLMDIEAERRVITENYYVG